MSPDYQRRDTIPPPKQCSTLLDDEMTRCTEIPTHGNPLQRCHMHHEQYRTMTKRYKEAQKFVDETFAGALIPSKEDVQNYTSIPKILEQARLVKKYVNAIREERAGRDIHHKRFFLKMDDGHRIRFNTLARQMTEAVEIRDALEAWAVALHMEDHPAKDWMEEFQTAPLGKEDDEATRPGEGVFSYICAKQDKLWETVASEENDDVIELKLQLCAFKAHENHVPGSLPPVSRRKADTAAVNTRNISTYFRDTGKTPPLEGPEERNRRDTLTNAWLQYTRRIIFHDSHLFAKSLDKVSFKDFVMDDDFGSDDVLRITTMYGRRLEMGLRWWKDSLTEAIKIKDSSEASANMGSMANRFKILGGWIYNNSRNTPAPNKVWWILLTTDAPANNAEHRYVRLCCNFDELHTFLTFRALLQRQDTPSFCADESFDSLRNSSATRNHLSLCGVVLADLIPGKRGFQPPGPVPSPIPAKRRGCITWVELEMRPYMFGALRNKPDSFTKAFLAELRSRPDLFTVVTRSDTDPARKINWFGKVMHPIRRRQFEAPSQPVQNAPIVPGPVDKAAGQGYLSDALDNNRGAEGRMERSFFLHKRFPVKYFLILSASPIMNVHDLARQVAWVAFRAHGLVQGEYNKEKYDKASDVLFKKHARERLSFLPDGGHM
ncbi:hypothetical protein C8F04DRAFT_1198586 [Mycena alexandri]|uniref:Uncharacterized protein n=1 Tax=Mycena alexandri TaxID=1745969 RepID=A0AAD6S1S4_9AGAR|nr:hypothetical protein C8F04DRAFT_1198586 [Mycena alexandri]